ncbi:hypothetical protein WDL1P1_00175 (plasmid) [Variovorax sp. WDL1]|nr:hypothetical protein WDL1P1_00175 [Variovorax sp. WDL1]
MTGFDLRMRRSWLAGSIAPAAKLFSWTVKYRTKGFEPISSRSHACSTPLA